MRKETISIIVSVIVMAGLKTPCWLHWSYFTKLERQASRGNKALREWTAVECKSVWEFAVELCENETNRRNVAQEELPQLLQIIGFENATVSSNKFDARLGVSSFGSSPAMVRCWPNGDEHGSKPRIIFGWRHYNPETNKIEQ